MSLELNKILSHQGQTDDIRDELKGTAWRFDMERFINFGEQKSQQRNDATKKNSIRKCWKMFVPVAASYILIY